MAVLLLLCTTAFAQEKTDSLGRAEEAVQTMKIASPEDLIARATIAYEQGNYAQTIADYAPMLHVARMHYRSARRHMASGANHIIVLSNANHVGVGDIGIQ